MKSFNGFEAKQSGGREILPAGGYVAKILEAKEVSYEWGSVIQISFDVAEGPHKDFFAADYKQQDKEDRKWRGTFRLRLPKDDGTEQDDWTKRSFGNAVWAIEASNVGYHFDWDENKFVGKLVGVLFRNKEWEYNGKTGWTTEACSLTSTENIRNGKYKMPKDKPLAAASSTSAFGFTAAPADPDDDLPF